MSIITNGMLRIKSRLYALENFISIRDQLGQYKSFYEYKLRKAIKNYG